MIREYTTHFVFLAIHSVIVIYTVLVTATNLKIHGYPEVTHFADPFSIYVRHFGMSLMVIPALWLWFTNWIDRERYNHTGKIVVISGIAVIGVLVMIGMGSMIGATPRGPIRIAD